MSNANYQRNFIQTEEQAKLAKQEDESREYQNQKMADFYQDQKLQQAIKASPFDISGSQLILPKHLQRKIDMETWLRTTEIQREAISRLFDYDRTDIPTETKLAMIMWMRQNTFLLCPHCWCPSNPCIRIQHPGFGIAMCRHEDCGQSFNAWEVPIINRDGREVSQDDLPEGIKAYL